ncbi:MAG: hypothetical protein FWC71_04635 [Defluviitaleaceae bacterium]|nr:hypothetical protein [Defluviitaleaceae bacterium]
MKTFFCLSMILLTLMFLAACGTQTAPDDITPHITEPFVDDPEPIALPPSTGRIFMFGETHGDGAILERVLEIWSEFYHDYGMRHFFLENSYFGAQWLNLWMHADDDTILYALFADWHDTSKNNPYQLDFYRAFKRDFPETIFHGVDIGHQSNTSGQRFIQYLITNNLTNTTSYALTRENMQQFNHFQSTQNHGLRSSVYMPKNFIREFDRLGNQDIMIVNGGAHTHIGYFQGQPGVPTLASVLYERYGNALHLFDLTHYASPVMEPLRTDIINVAGIDFEASYFGLDDTAFGNITGREFWRLENAYDAFYDRPLTGDVLPFRNIPTRVQIGQVFIMDVHRTDGSVTRMHFRASGYIWQNMQSLQEFIP